MFGILPILGLLVSFSVAQDCGKTPILPKLDFPQSAKIVGGNKAVPYSWPWQVEVCTKSWGECDLLCGGSLIAPEWVLTAAHCVEDLEKYPDYFGIKIGTYDYSDDNEPGEVVRYVDEIYRHPLFRYPLRHSNDIALIHIKGGPVNYTNHIQPICLPKSLDDKIIEGKTAYVTGWGAVQEKGNVSKELLQAGVPFLNATQCEEEYPNKIDETMECAGTDGIDSCQGDSGGPLVIYHKPSERWFQVAIVSWGTGCASPGYSGVYQKTAVHCEFIKEKTGLDLCI
uniref:Peptidase S1 domain-containing protein n=1 Tax=Syphacia muris TaxID=451379 RepID=A0A158R5J4_9BILA